MAALNDVILATLERCRSAWDSAAAGASEGGKGSGTSPSSPQPRSRYSDRRRGTKKPVKETVTVVSAPAEGMAVVIDSWSSKRDGTALHVVVSEGKVCMSVFCPSN